jgi:hypothetical protein
MSVHQTGHQQLSAIADDAGPGIFGRNAANDPFSLTMPSVIATAPAGITPVGPRRGSVIAYAPRIMMVSVMA